MKNKSLQADAPFYIYEKYLVVKTNADHWHWILLKQILYIKSDRNYINIVTTNGHNLIIASLVAIYAILPRHKFLRTHNSYIVNMKKFSDHEKTCVYFGETKIPISRSHRDEFFDHLMQGSNFWPDSA